MFEIDNYWNNEEVLIEDLLKNIHGTSKDRYLKSDGMKQFWIDKSGRDWPEKCCIKGCNKEATEGSHMKKVMGSSEWYIVPTCHEHNINYDGVFELESVCDAIRLND